MKKHLMPLLLLFVFSSMSVQKVFADDESECNQRFLEYQRLESKKTKDAYKRMLEILIFFEKNHCGYSKDEIKKRRNAINAILYPRPKETEVTLDPITIEAEKDAVVVYLKHGTDLRVSVPSWLKFQETGDMDSLEFVVERNLLPYSRSYDVVIEDGKKHRQVTITQKAAPLEANVTEHLGFGQDAGKSFIFIETNDTAWTVSESENWITTELEDDGVFVDVTSNPTKKKRSGKVKVQFACGETRYVDITQAIGRTTLSVPQKSYTFDYDGGEKNNVSVVCNYDQWSATPSVSWLKTKKKYGGISIECAPNSMAETRSGNVKVETNDAEHLVEYIIVRQGEAPAYISAEQSQYKGDGYEQAFNVKVKTNIPSTNWNATVEKGRDWTSVSSSGNYAKVYLKRNDCRYSRTSTVKLYGKGKSYLVSFSQPNRGYIGRYRDYFDAKGGDWRITWLSMDVHGLTTIGNNVALANVRWKPVEISMLNFNMDYMLEDMFSFNWEPVIRGYMPVSRDGKWAAFTGMGGHVCMIGGLNYFLFEMGVEAQWSEKCSSRIFFKYNGGCSLGISFDIGRWR